MPEKRVVLSKKLKGPIVIEGFPGFGLVSTIATGYLLDHLKFEQIGKYWFEEIQPTIAVHGCKMVDPIGIYYNDKYNIVLIHSIVPANGNEWQAARVVIDVCQQVQAKELITIEGVGTSEPGETRGFFFTDNPVARKKFEKAGIECLGEGIIVGVSSALLMLAPQEKIKMSCLFAEAQSKLPDSKSAAKIIELLDTYLSLKVDYKPLLKQAQVFEEKLKKIVSQSQEAKSTAEQKQLSYVG